MPREIRTLKRVFFADEKLTTVPRATRLTFLGLIANADDYGRLRADPRLLKASIYPLDEDITASDVSSELDELESIDRIRRYEVEGTLFLEIANFDKHQVMNRKYASDVPAPPTHCVRTADALRTHGSKGEERRGASVGEERSGVVGPAIVQIPTPPSLPPDEVDAVELPASLMDLLPPEALQVLATFYEQPAMTFNARKRYKAVAMQLCDAMDPRHPGPSIRGGQRVKARSVEHMADVCRVVLKDPPMDRDLAIVWVLKKLLDPPKGPSVTEVMARAESASRQEEEEYDRAARSAGVAWAQENPEEYEPIRLAVEAAYKGKSGMFVKAAKTADLTQRCAQACGFPTFEKWQRESRVGAA